MILPAMASGDRTGGVQRLRLTADHEGQGARRQPFTPPETGVELSETAFGPA